MHTVTRTESWSPRLRPIAANPMTGERARFRKRALRFNLGLALLVWIAWAVVGGNAAFHALFANWRVAVTMVFGSLVGGGTSEGRRRHSLPRLHQVASYCSANCPELLACHSDCGNGGRIPGYPL